jgi:hypothetical protein
MNVRFAVTIAAEQAPQRSHQRTSHSSTLNTKLRRRQVTIGK